MKRYYYTYYLRGDPPFRVRKSKLLFKSKIDAYWFGIHYEQAHKDEEIRFFLIEHNPDEIKEIDLTETITEQLKLF